MHFLFEGRSVHPNLSAATPPPLARANSSGAQARLMSPAMSSPQTHNAQQVRSSIYEY